jgi:glycosyltransferase involved in cell wall biosynthesis
MRELGYDVVPAVAPCHSKGIWRRLFDIVWARRNRSDINHITGDVHFLVLGLPPDRNVLTIHDCYKLDHLRGLRRWILRVLWFNLPIGRSAAVTVISEESKRRLLAHVPVPEEKIVVIPDAASPVFRPCSRPFRQDCPTILHVGTGANKNLPRLIEALRGLRCRLKIIGLLNDALRCQLSDAGISYESAADLDEAAMYREYCDADLVSFISTYEGFGMPILEAQWVERPVVTSNLSSMPEVAGSGACLVDPFDVQSIRNGIVRVMSDAAYRNGLVEEGRRNRERFSLEKVARQYIELYERVARGAES